ncbi:MAG: NADH-quinone oxidoreductase subunit K [Chloroflexota bacterium]|jgi:NADH-quinone oxidoreductase subunit K
MSFSTANIGTIGVVGLLGVGLYCLLITRNLIKLVVALQIMVKAAVLGLVAAGSVSGQVQLSQSLAVTVIVADTVVAVIGLALAVQVRRQLGTLDVGDLSQLRG